jgi:hypothetical protein
MPALYSEAAHASRRGSLHLRVTATVMLETPGTPTIASSQLEAHGVVPQADAAAFDRVSPEPGS